MTRYKLYIQLVNGSPLYVWYDNVEDAQADVGRILKGEPITDADGTMTWFNYSNVSVLQILAKD